MNKGKIYTLFFSVLVCIGMCGIAIGENINFDKENYSVRVGQTFNVDVDLDYTPLNTTAGDYTDVHYIYMFDGDGYKYDLTNNDISDISDFDGDTGLTFNDTVTVMWIHMENGISDFNGVWAKKDIGLLIDWEGIDGIMVQNNTYGIGSEAFMCMDDSGNVDLYFPTNVNISYKHFGSLYDGWNDMTLQEYVDSYGSIDNVSFTFNSGGTGNADDGLWTLYEFHLFNWKPYIVDYYIMGEGAGYNNYVLKAWGIVKTDNGDGTYVFAITVPNNEQPANYFLYVEDNLGNHAQTTITVLNTQTSTNTIIYPIIAFCFALGFGALADYWADRPKMNKISVVFAVSVAVVSALIGSLMITDILGWTHIGIVPNF